LKPWCLTQHVAWEGPGLVASAARARGIDLRVHRMDLGDRLPDASAIGGVVVLGGPMGANDDAAYPHLAAEKTLLASAVAAGLPVLGICLGGQLLAAALGARVTRNPSREIGLCEVAITPEGRDDPVLGPLAPSFPAIQWHDDTFDIPEGAVRLAESAACPRQAYRLGDRVYGLQFHPELDAEVLRAWTPHFPEGVAVDEVAHARAARASRGLIGRFFDRASSPTLR